MQAAQAFWHIAGFLVTPLVLGGLSAFAARLLWRRDMSGCSVWRLWAWASTAAALASFAGLMVSGRDGQMATYAAMVLASAVALWWMGFRSAGR
ncbi:MAG TPA: hypothetical protein VHM00_07410 [Caldimonas sp.]|nr:hypothetical protein [Caldimonas sp.]HEX2540895.1 hypothetical protein [Caldimonas sp.]